MKTGAMILGAAALLAVGAIGYRVAADRPAAETPLPDDRPAALARLERAAADQPRDVAAQRDLGRAYFALGRYADAATLTARAVAIAPRDGALWATLGEARTLAANAVTPDAHTAFARALAIDPKDPRARYFLAVEKDVAGDHAGAVADWTGMLADAPTDAPWIDSVRRLVTQVATREKIAVVLPPGAPARTDPAAAIPGPSADQMTAAAQMTPGQQDGMARGMVDRLAARLAADPRDETGWVRLIRARMVLGDPAGAGKARDAGLKAFADDAAAQARIRAAAQTLGIAR